MTSTERPFLHIASGRGATTAVRLALRHLGRDEEVVSPSDDCITTGPLEDIDAGARSRVAWWKRISGEDLDDNPFDDQTTWERVRDDTRHVVIWDGPHPVDRLVALRACWWLRGTPERVSEIVLPPNTRNGLAAFYGAVAIVDRNFLAENWPRRRRVTDVDTRAAEWERLRAGGACVRELHNNAIVEVPIDHYDEMFVEFCRRGWTSSLSLAGRITSEHALPFHFTNWRIRALIEQRGLEARGALNRIGLPEELRSIRVR